MNIRYLLPVVIAMVMPGVLYAGYNTTADDTQNDPACSGTYTTSGACPSSISVHSGTYIGNCDSITCIRGFKDNSGNEYGVNSCNRMKSSVSTDYYFLRSGYAIYSNMQGQSYCFVGYTYISPCVSAKSSCSTGTTDSTNSTTHVVTRKTTTWTCSGGCTTSTAYLCDIGYYGTNGNCTKCPSHGTYNADATTPGLGAGAMQACYFASGDPFSDGTGSGVFTADCRYK